MTDAWVRIPQALCNGIERCHARGFQQHDMSVVPLGEDRLLGSLPRLSDSNLSSAVEEHERLGGLTVGRPFFIEAINGEV